MGRPWRVVGADVSRVGAGGSCGGLSRLLALAADGAPPLGPVAAQLPTRAKPVWAPGITAMSRGVQGVLVAEVRGL